MTGTIRTADAPSVFDLFTIGIGPSSSHTVGPMRAAERFQARLDRLSLVDATVSVEVDLYGSLAATGAGHGTLDAVLAGLEGSRPDAITPERLRAQSEAIAESGVLLAGRRPMPLRVADIRLHPLTILPGHPNGMRFTARDAAGVELESVTCYSIGGGFITFEGDADAAGEADAAPAAVEAPLPFATAAVLLEHCRREGMAVSEVMRTNELAARSAPQIREQLLRIRDAMDESVAASVAREGLLPGRLGVRRRARAWHERLLATDAAEDDPAYWTEWVDLVALAVNEENASGGRIVTAPTNGAAGIIPAVLHYATRYAAPDRDRDDVAERFLLTAGAIGVLYKAGASISGAEVGCQGEVGSASSMAAGALTEVLGGTPQQVENAAEIAMEHNLGLTCDPVGGLVQIPCIERNAIGAVKAIAAAKMALWGDGGHSVSLDAVIATMRATGLDMSSKYKETSLGGLAVNVVEC